MFAGIATAVLVTSATASFSATATVTAAPSKILSGSISQSASATADFQPLRNAYGAASWLVDAGWNAKPIRVNAGATTWLAEGNFSAIIFTEVFSSADWTATASADFTPFAKFADVDFGNGTATFDAEAVRIHGPLGDWLATNQTFLTDPALNIVDRRVTAEWQGNTEEFFIEPNHYVLLDDTTYVNAYGRFNAGATFEEDPSKTIIFVGDAVLRATTSLEIIPTLIHGGSGLWLDNNNWLALPYRTSFVAADFAQAGLDWEAVGAFIQKSSGSWSQTVSADLVGYGIRAGQGTFNVTTSATFEEALMVLAGKAGFVANETELTINGVYNATAAMFIGADSSFFVDNTKVAIRKVRQAEASWTFANALTSDDSKTKVPNIQQGTVNAVAVASIVLKSTVFINGFGNWIGDATSMTGGAVLTPPPGVGGDGPTAPSNRQLTISAESRGFVIPYEERSFVVSPTTSSFDI